MQARRELAIVLGAQLAGLGASREASFIGVGVVGVTNARILGANWGFMVLPHLPQVTNFGLVYYGQFKVTADSGSGPLVDELLAGRKDRVFGVGLEGNIFLPTPKLLLGLRVVPEFGARNRTQGSPSCSRWPTRRSCW